MRRMGRIFRRAQWVRAASPAPRAERRSGGFSRKRLLLGGAALDGSARRMRRGCPTSSRQPPRIMFDRRRVPKSVPVAAPHRYGRHTSRPRIEHEYSNRPLPAAGHTVLCGASRRKGQIPHDGDSFGRGEPTQGVIRVFVYHSRTAGPARCSCGRMAVSSASRFQDSPYRTTPDESGLTARPFPPQPSPSTGRERFFRLRHRVLRNGAAVQPA